MWAAMLGAFVALALLLSGCTTETTFGECVGAFDDEDPALVYRTSGRNVALAIVFSETVWVPVNVIGWNAKCPVAIRRATATTTAAVKPANDGGTK